MEGSLTALCCLYSCFAISSECTILHSRCIVQCISGHCREGGHTLRRRVCLSAGLLKQLRVNFHLIVGRDRPALG